MYFIYGFFFKQLKQFETIKKNRSCFVPVCVCVYMLHTEFVRFPAWRAIRFSLCRFACKRLSFSSSMVESGSFGGWIGSPTKLA